MCPSENAEKEQGAALPALLIVPAHAGAGGIMPRISQWLLPALGGEAAFAFLKELIEILKTDWKLNGKKGTA